jgi:hypothetical protein
LDSRREELLNSMAKEAEKELAKIDNFDFLNNSFEYS